MYHIRSCVCCEPALLLPYTTIARAVVFKPGRSAGARRKPYSDIEWTTRSQPLLFNGLGGSYSL